MLRFLVLPRHAPLAFLLFLACIAGPVQALTYVDVIDDDPDLSTDQRLARLDKRLQKQVEHAAEIAKSHAAIKMAIEQGEKTTLLVQEKERLLLAAADSSTVRTALGDGAARGLEWHCARAREILPRLAQVVTLVRPTLTAYPAQLRAITVGGQNATADLQAIYIRLQTNMTQLMATQEQNRTRSDLEEIESGLQHAWGSYTTLQSLAREMESIASTLHGQSVSLDKAADDIESSIRRWFDEHASIRGILGSLNPEYPAEIALRDSIKSRWDAQQLPGLDPTPQNLVATARSYGPHLQAAAAHAQSAVQQSLKPFTESVQPCGIWQDPARDFAAARSAAQQPLDELFIRIDETCVARTEQSRQSKSTIDDVIRTSQETVTDLDTRLAAMEQHGQNLAPGDAAAHDKVRSLQAQGNNLRNEALAEISRMESARQQIDAEIRAVEQQRAAMTTIKSILLMSPTDK